MYKPGSYAVYTDYEALRYYVLLHRILSKHHIQTVGQT